MAVPPLPGDLVSPVQAGCGSPSRGGTGSGHLCRAALTVVLGAALLLAASTAHALSVNWKIASSGLWNTSTNWDPNGIPAPGDDVTVDVNDNPYDITLQTGPNGAINSLTVSASNARLQVVGRELRLRRRSLNFAQVEKSRRGLGQRENFSPTTIAQSFLPSPASSD